MTLLDTFRRPLGNLRLSVTDRCNLRCQYCMPEPDYAWLPRENILDFEEIAELVDAFTALGVDRVRITGGEPLLRRELPRLVAMIAARPAVRRNIWWALSERSTPIHVTSANGVAPSH